MLLLVAFKKFAADWTLKLLAQPLSLFGAGDMAVLNADGTTVIEL